MSHPLHLYLLHGPGASFEQDKLVVSCARQEHELQATTVAYQSGLRHTVLWEEARTTPSTNRKPKFESSLRFLSQFVPSLLTLLCTVLSLLEKMSQFPGASVS